MKTLNKYLIPELVDIVLDYYYYTMHKNNTGNLVSEYHKTYTFDTYNNCLLLLEYKYRFKAYNFRMIKDFKRYNYNVHNKIGPVAILPRNYL